LDGIVVIKAKRVGSSIFLAGSKNQKCESAGQPFFGEFHEPTNVPADGKIDNAVRGLVVETGLYGGGFVDFDEQGDKFVLAGGIETRTNEWTDFGSTKTNYATYSGLPYERNDAFLVAFQLGHENSYAEPHFIDAGSDVFVNGLAMDGRSIVFAGSVGHHALWGRYVP
jgi:hypothetical protein